MHKRLVWKHLHVHHIHSPVLHTSSWTAQDPPKKRQKTLSSRKKINAHKCNVKTKNSVWERILHLKFIVLFTIAFFHSLFHFLTSPKEWMSFDQSNQRDLYIHWLVIVSTCHGVRGNWVQLLPLWNRGSEENLWRRTVMCTTGSRQCHSDRFQLSRWHILNPPTVKSIKILY